MTWLQTRVESVQQKIHENILSLSETQRDSSLFRCQSATTVTMEDSNVFLLYDWINSNRQRALSFQNPSQQSSNAIHLLSLIGLSETALRACVTTLASEEKPCYQLFSVCYLQNSIERLNKQEELLSGCSICVRALTHVHTHRSKQTDPLLLSTMRTQPGGGYVHSTHQCLLSGVWLLVAWQVCILIRGTHPHGYSRNSFHNSSGLLWCQTLWHNVSLWRPNCMN